MNAPLSHLPARAPHALGHFSFRGPGGTIRSDGSHLAVEAGTVDTLEGRIAAAFRDRGPDAVLGGALPFLKGQADHLWCAERVVSRFALPRAAPAVAEGCALRADPPKRDFADAVARMLDILRHEADQPEGLRKIVLARTLAVTAARPIPVEDLLARLSEDDSVTAFRVGLPSAGESRALVGATPELLLEKRGRMILSYPLAGSARRSTETGEDALACAALAHSDKDRREHAMVVEYILDALAPHCRQLSCPDGTRLTCTRSMWHLGTRIVGELKDDEIPVPVLAARLHPTPAVCGLPCRRAAELIEQVEPVARDFYAGAVGWCDRRGDGAWYVAIRCADISGREARLYAGAGIVAGSEPMAEAAETGSKFAAMLRALGLPGDAALSD